MDEPAATESAIRLVAGLGNPGNEFAGTRHNVGFEVLDLLAVRLGAAWESKSAWRAEVARCGPGLLLVKPMTYMNLSGEAVAAVARFHKWEPSSVLVVYDDSALPLGRLRMRRTGSHGGHNGMRSVIRHFGTQDVPRLRVGIGDKAGKDLTSHVLGKFSPREAEEAQLAISSAADAIECALKKGIDTAMNIHNKSTNNYE